MFLLPRPTLRGEFREDNMNELLNIRYTKEGEVFSQTLICEKIETVKILGNYEYEINGTFWRDETYFGELGTRQYLTLSNGLRFSSLIKELKYYKTYSIKNGRFCEEGKLSELATTPVMLDEPIGYVLFGKFYQSWEDLYESDDFDGHSHKDCYSLVDVARFVANFQDSLESGYFEGCE